MPQLLAFTDSPPLGAGEPAVDRYLQDMPMLNLYRATELPAQAERIADQLAQTPEGRRAVQPFYILAFALKASEYHVDALGIYERGWIDVSRDVAGLAELAVRLDRRGVTLDFIYCDNENDLTPWTLGQDRLVEIYKSEEAVNRMPARLRTFDPATLKFMSPEYHQWMIELGAYAQKIRMESLRKALCDSGLMSPWSQTTSAGNFFSIRTSFRLFDLNGWEIEHQSLPDNRTSCPVAYPGPVGQRYGGRAHHIVWNSFIDCLNHARSAAAVSDIIPIIREPLRARGQPRGSTDPGALWLSNHLLGHLVRTGAKRFMLFNPNATAADDIALGKTLERHDGAAPDINPHLPEIPLDVDEIVTADFRTTYSEFLRQEPERWAPQG